MGIDDYFYETISQMDSKSQVSWSHVLSELFEVAAHNQGLFLVTFTTE